MTSTWRAWSALLVTLLSVAGCASDGRDEKSELDPSADAEVADAGDTPAPAAASADGGQDGGRTVPSDASTAGRADASGKDASAVEDVVRDAGTTAADASRDASRDAGLSLPDAGGSLVDTIVEATIVVKAGASFDGTGKRFLAGPALGDGSQSESQKPVFKLEDGATLRNVVIGAPAADGIHTHGDATLENIVWQDIGEDALTIKEEGTVELRGGSASQGEDKIFQINAASTFRVSDFRASDAGKFIRQNGGTDFEVQVFIDRCDISNMDEAIFRTDSASSSVTMTNSRYSKIGDSLFIGVSESKIVQRDNSEY